MRLYSPVLTRAFLPAAIALCGACGSESKEDPSLAAYFKRAGFQGSFVMLEQKTGKYIHHNRPRNSRGFLPASTFKVMNSLIGLETGVMKDANHELPWDGKKRALEFWNRNHTLRSAFRFSAVWYYQTMARRIGQERMGAWLKKTGYGNGDISSGVDRFWLEGGFRVTPMEQIKLLQRLYRGDLPFSKRSMNIVKDIMLLEKTGTHILRGKSGLAARGKGGIGWWIGWVEKGDSVYYFATCIEAGKIDRGFIDAREKISREILKHLGVLPAPENKP